REVAVENLQRGHRRCDRGDAAAAELEAERHRFARVGLVLDDQAVDTAARQTGPPPEVAEPGDVAGFDAGGWAGKSHGERRAAAFAGAPRPHRSAVPVD